MRKIIILGILSMMLGVFFGWAKEGDTEATNKEVINKNPQKVIEDYFKYKNERNVEKLNALYYEEISDFRLDNVESIKLRYIKEDVTNRMTEGYLKYGPGKTQGITKENIKAYDVTYEVTYKDENIEPLTNGVHDISFVVIRDSEDSPWLIGGQGQ
ncbi:DUF4829 domain-containing protein [Priestia taiwanensis]|uniref:DUF4829 domain-containing protein n=1 Tax=Priestia taiwanensis TaxID=1347902 RepID=A0A917ALT8_9BACI|nr:DUF4829 domain-containing protein [Priestia taiwanensis]MBM7362290.1 hypothetical protein [Priestia taiwanensis]GGE61002.1 hypothetical protein GCM10007140_09120 [Priestia taiwanensis]